MAKPDPIIAGVTFLEWRTRYNSLLSMVPEVVTAAAADPSNLDDAYDIGAFWVREDNDSAWILVNTTGADDAVWAKLTGGLNADGTVPLTGNWDAGNFEIRASTFYSDVAPGTPPFIVGSDTRVDNLNADLLDGEEGEFYLDLANSTGSVGTARIDDDAVTFDKLENIGAYTLIMRASPQAGSAQDFKVTELGAGALTGAFVLGEDSGGVLRNLSVDAILSRANHTGTTPTSGIADDAVTNTKLANMPPNSIKLRGNSAGDPTDTKISALVEQTSATAGDALLMETSGGLLRKVDSRTIRGMEWSFIANADYSIEAGEAVVVTTAAIDRTVTLPAVFSEGDEVLISHQSAGTAALFVARNGSEIYYKNVINGEAGGAADDIELETGDTVHLVATSTTRWYIV